MKEQTIPTTKLTNDLISDLGISIKTYNRQSANAIWEEREKSVKVSREKKAHTGAAVAVIVKERALSDQYPTIRKLFDSYKSSINVSFTKDILVDDVKVYNN